MKRILTLALIATAFAAPGCGAASAERAARGGADETAPPVAADDPPRLTYDYETAKALGIDVPPIPPEEELCPSEADSTDTKLTENPTRTCIADPRLAVYSVGYSIEAARAAPTAFEKGVALCENYAPSLPAGMGATELDRFTRRHLRHAIGVDAADDIEQLIAGCRTTSWGRYALKP